MKNFARIFFLFQGCFYYISDVVTLSPLMQYKFIAAWITISAMHKFSDQMRGVRVCADDA